MDCPGMSQDIICTYTYYVYSGTSEQRPRQGMGLLALIERLALVQRLCTKHTIFDGFFVFLICIITKE